MKLSAILQVCAATVLSAAGKEEVLFTLHLPSVKIGYPGVEYWAEVEGPKGEGINGLL